MFGDSINILGLFQFERIVEAKPRYKSSLYLISLRKVKTRFSFPAIFFSLTEASHLRVLMGHQRGDTETHTNREAARVASRPGIARALPPKQIKHYKTNAF